MQTHECVHKHAQTQSMSHAKSPEFACAHACRFRDVSTLRHTPRKQHPVYTTTANDIGLKKPTQLDMPDVYAGSAGGFTKTFTGKGVSKNSNSRAHRHLSIIAQHS